MDSAAIATTLLQTFGPSIAELGFGGVAGYAVGFFLKKIIKIILYVTLFFFGVEIAILGYLESIDAISITVNYARFNEISAEAGAWATNQIGGLVTLLTGISMLGAGFTGGLLLGFSKG